MRQRLLLAIATIGLSTVAFAELKTLKPGFNLFSKDQDVQLGREAAAQVEQKMPIMRDPAITNYIAGIGQRLARSPRAGGFPFTFKVVADKNINAFALPGGPVYIHAGTIAQAENEAQLAGVIAHEMSHVALRHGTNQASKANLIQIPAMLAGAVAGRGMLGQLAQLGIGLGANSVLLKMSRTDESQADYNGAAIMAEAGYNPLEMAHFFEKLERQSGKQGSVAQFLSDHPNPGNRVKAVEEEIQQMPQRAYNNDQTGQFQNMRDMMLHQPAAGQLRGAYNDGHQAPTAPPSRPSGNLREYQGQSFAVSYPDNWQVYGGDKESSMVTIAPQQGLVQDGRGNTAVGYGAMASYYFPEGNQLDLRRDTDALARQMQKENPGMQVRDSRSVTVGGQPGLLTTLNSRSPYQGETEVDALVTVARPEGLWYMVFIAPQSEFRNIQSIFENMIRSVRFSR